MRFEINITFSYHTICQLAWQGQLNAKNTYVSAMFWGGEKLVAKVVILKFENKGLVETLKVEKCKKNRGKWLNLLEEKDNGPQLYSPSRVCAAQEFVS